MRTKALRQYGKRDLRLEEFDLPPIGDDELLVKIMSDSVCMSTYKSAIQGADHKRVPGDVAENPIIVGHEFCGEIIEVGASLKSTGAYMAGQRFAIQPAMKGTYDAAGYSFKYLGGDSQYAIIPKCYIEQDCVLPYNGSSWFQASMAEPMSCVVGAAHSCYHTRQGEYTHTMGIRENGKAAALAAAGPMGLALIDYLIHCSRRPSTLIVTDIDNGRLARAKSILTPEEAARNGVDLKYINTAEFADPAAALLGLSGGDRGDGNGDGHGSGRGDGNGDGHDSDRGDGHGDDCGDGHGGGRGDGYDDVFVFAPVSSVVEQADAILGCDGCLNFFAGPSDTRFSANFNFYNVHYNATHIVGTSGGNTCDMKESLELAASGVINPSILITHIGGLDAACDTILRLPEIPGGKKLIYTHISMPLTAIDDFAELGKADPLFANLADMCDKAGGLWNGDAERYLLENARPI